MAWFEGTSAGHQCFLMFFSMVVLIFPLKTPWILQQNPHAKRRCAMSAAGPCPETSATAACTSRKPRCCISNLLKVNTGGKLINIYIYSYKNYKMWNFFFLAPNAALLPRGSCHQALWPSAFTVPGLQPALCLHIALCCYGIQSCRLPGFKRLNS